MKTTGAPEALNSDASHSVCDGSSHPFDEWLRRELAQQNPTDDAEPLPPELVLLASRLEQVLGLSNSGEKPSGPESDNADRGFLSAKAISSDGGKQNGP